MSQWSSPININKSKKNFDHFITNENLQHHTTNESV